MKITTGEFRGRSISLPKGSRARPVTGYILEQVMNLFTPDRISSAPFLDICAGSGLVGLEAMSRGAPVVVSVEIDTQASRAIRDTAASWGASDRIFVLRRDGRRCFNAAMKLISDHPGFGCVFLDPPYIEGMARDLIGVLGLNSGCIAPGGLVIIRTPDRLPQTMPGLEFIERRDAGNARLWLWRPDPAAEISCGSEE